MNSNLSFPAPNNCKFSSNSIQNCDRRSDDRQTADMQTDRCHRSYNLSHAML